MEPFGKILKRYREAKDLTLYKLEQLTGVNRSNIKRAEDGIDHASDNLLKDLAPHLGVPYETLKAKRIISELTPEELEALKKELCES